MTIKSNYFTMNKDDFNDYLLELKKSNNTINLLDNNFFYVQNVTSSNLIITLKTKVNELDLLINSFTDFTKKQIIQSFLLDEISSTNKIENIFSTKHDIYSIINNVSTSKNKKIISISNAYKHLLETKGQNITKIEDIRSLYDIILKDAISKEDVLDGKVFRKNPVFITNGIKNVHVGTINESNIMKFMEEFLSLYNSDNELFLKMILCHFIFEYVHPFYDGNGRLGRYLFSNGLYLTSNSYFSFLISSSFEHEKNKYYKAFKAANDQYEFGCLNNFVDMILEILIKQIDNNINKLKDDKEKIKELIYPFKMTKNEVKVFSLISEASIFSTFGVSSEEIIKETSISKRSLIYALNNFKSKNILSITKIGKYNYYKFQENK